MSSISPWTLTAIVMLSACVGAGVMAVSDVIIERMQQRERARVLVQRRAEAAKAAQRYLEWARDNTALLTSQLDMTPGQRERLDAIKKGIRPEFVRDVLGGADPDWVERQVKNLCDSDE